MDDEPADEWAVLFQSLTDEDCPRAARALVQCYVGRHPEDAFAARLLDRMDLWTPRAGTVLHEGPEGPGRWDGSSHSLKLLPALPPGAARFPRSGAPALFTPAGLYPSPAPPG